MSFFWESMSTYLTPQGMKSAVELLTNPKMTIGGGTIMDNIYNLYQTQVKVQGGGGSAKLRLSKEAKQKIQTFVTSKRVLRGGQSIAEIFLKVVSPHGFEMIQKAVGGASKQRVAAATLKGGRSRGGAASSSQSAKSGKSRTPKQNKAKQGVRVAVRQKGGKWWWPFCDDGTTSNTVALDGAVMKATLPNAASINNLPGATQSTQSLEMLKLTSLMDRANSLGNQRLPTNEQITQLPKVLSPAATSYTVDATSPYNAYFRL